MRRRRAALVTLAAAFAAGVLFPSPAGGTILEQRKRLPPAPAQDACADPVTGLWRAHTYYPRQADWYIIHLKIRREGDELITGQIEVRGWPGVPDKPEPQPCKPGHQDYLVLQPAKGTIKGLELTLGGTSWSRGKPYCEESRSGGYILDTFIGKIDPALQEFQSVNRYPLDGEMVEDVTVFRRIECLGEAKPASTPEPATPSPPPAVTPLPASEPHTRFDCSCRR